MIFIDCNWISTRLKLSVNLVRNSNQMHKSQTFLFNLIITLHVSVVDTTHHQEHKATASTAFGKHYTVHVSGVVTTHHQEHKAPASTASGKHYTVHVSGVVITHHQEHKATASTASGKHYTVLLSAAVVGKLELVWVCWNYIPDYYDARTHKR
jgi:hypothetical protein